MVYHTPEDTQPPFPAWTAEFSGIKDILFAQIGVQSGEVDSDAFDRIAQTLNSARHIDRAFFEDSRGVRNDVLLAYWDNDEAYTAWLESPAVKTWREHIEEGVGKWLELARIPPAFLETLYTTENHEAGVSYLASEMPVTDRHGYWGAMRDRIPATEADALLPSLSDSVLAHARKNETKGRRLRVKAPDNLCFIRTAQNWSDCSDDERATYLNLVAPVLAEGVRFLCTMPLESGCCAGRFLTECDLNTGAPLYKTCMAAYFFSLGHLERWSKGHPSHLAIYDSFMKMVQKHNFQITIKLWHEVWVVPGNHLHLEYNNCHWATGLLPWFEAEELRS